MNRITRFLGLAVLALCLCPLVSRAAIGQTKNLTNTGSSVICIPGADDQLIVIQNNGSGSVRLSFDGGAGYVTPTGGKTGTNPTPTTGYLLAVGAQVIISTAPYTANSQPNLHKPIVAILTSTTTTIIDIVTDGISTQFPTT